MKQNLCLKRRYTQRHFLQFLFVCICIVMIILPVSILYAEEIGGYREIKEITMGSYPQSRVKDQAVIEILNEQAEKAEWNYYTDYTGDGENFGTMKPDKLMKYTDITLNDGRYRGVVIEKYRPITTCSISDAGVSFQDDNGYTLNDEKSAYWFKYEPLTWIVTDENKGVLYCDKVVDAKPFNYNFYYDAECDKATIDPGLTVDTTDYISSDIRAWLNSDFYDTAFSAYEQSNIKTVAHEHLCFVDAAYNSDDTEDMVFLYSAASPEEVSKKQSIFDAGLTPYGWTPKSREITEGTDYAKCQGLLVDNFDRTEYWVETPAGLAGQVFVTDTDGNRGNVGTYQTYEGIRPAITVGNIIDYFGEENIEAIERIAEQGPFLKDSGTYHKDIALMAAKLSEAAEEEGYERIRDLFQGWGVDVENNYTSEGYGGDLAYAIACEDMGDYNLLMVVARGSKTPTEFIEDFATGATENNFLGKYTTYDLVFRFQEKIWEGMDDYLNQHPELKDEDKGLKILVTGHSLGGAAANLVGARIDLLLSRGEWLSDIVSVKDVFVYTFGAIDSVSQYNYRLEGKAIIKDRCNYNLPFVGEEFQNIHNVYNLYDSFSPYALKPYIYGALGAVFNIPGGKAFTMYGKFGDVGKETFAIDAGENQLLPTDTTNHNMSTYIYAVENNIVGNHWQAYHITIACPVDVRIYKDDAIVGSITDNQTDKNDEDVIMFVKEDVKHFFLPDGDSYRIEITATDTGRMSYIVESCANGMRVFDNITLENGKRFEAVINDEKTRNDEEELTELFAVDDQGERIRKVQEDGTESPVIEEKETGSLNDESKEAEKVQVKEVDNNDAEESNSSLPFQIIYVMALIVCLLGISFIIYKKTKTDKKEPT